MQRSRTDRPWIGAVERCGGIHTAARRLGDERIRDLDVARRVLRSLPAIQAYGRRWWWRRVRRCARCPRTDRQSVALGKGVSVRLDLGGCRLLQKKKTAIEK